LQLTSTNLYKSKRQKNNNISETSTLGWYSTEMANDLAKFGVVPRKTSTVDMPILNETVMPHLIRGMIDGDGCVSINSTTNKISCSFCGNEQSVTHLRDYLVSHLHIFNSKIL